jgi:5-formyltetrahydrofolate cyclo-ligase
MGIQKDRFRQSLRKRRAGFSIEEIELKSRSITAQLQVEVDWSQVRRVHCYASLEHEVATGELVRGLKYMGIEVTIPSHRIVEPTPAEISTAFDVVVVPMLGFDGSLHRLGYGGGYYDRLLVVQPQATKIGLCFEAGRVGELPIEAHDQELDMIITEHRVYRG